MTQPQPVLIGVDVGSTHTSGGLVTPGGEVLSVTETRTHRGGPGTALDTILGVVSNLLAQASDQGRSVEGIGVGLPGIVDIEGGTMRKGIHRVPELAGAPLVDLIRARSGVPVFIDNDVNSLALGEWTWGLGRGSASMVMLALGTGVGGAVILDGHLVRGKSGYGGELGHVSMKFDGRPCLCGIRGCLSAYAAGVGMAMEFDRRTHGDAAGRSPEANYHEGLTDAEAVFRAADAGSADARALVREACQVVGAAIGGIANGLNPDVVVITGGIVKSLERYEERILEHAAEYAFAATLAAARIHFVPGYKKQTVRGGAALVLYERARRAAIGERRAPRVSITNVAPPDGRIGRCPTTAEG
jgi:glucokinase